VAALPVQNTIRATETSRVSEFDMSLEQLHANLISPQICPNPVFVIGSPRSGTHGLAFALGNHSQFWTHSESEILYPLFSHDPVQPLMDNAETRVLPTWLRMFDVNKAELYGFLGLGINALFTCRNPGKRWIDKSPYYTLMAPILADMFPGASFLHIIRDGRRVVHSMIHFLDRFTEEGRRQILASGQIRNWAADFGQACQTWRRFMDAGTRFAEQYPNRCFTVRNEELVADPQKHFHAIYDFIGAPYEEEPVSFFRSFRINSSHQKDVPVNLASGNLSKPYGEWSLDETSHFLDPQPYRDNKSWQEWSVQQRDMFLAEAGEVLVGHGFAARDELDQWRQGKLPDEPTVAAKAATTPAAGDELARIRVLVSRTLPAKEPVLVVSKPEGSVRVQLDGRYAFRFPLVYYPANSEQAVEHLESLRRKGARYLLFPSSEFWWLEKYLEFNQYLNRRYARVWDDQDCLIFRLVPRDGAQEDEARGFWGAVFDKLRVKSS
jgi:hypothetical protein